MGICVSCRRRERKAPEKRSGAGLGAGGPGKGPAAAELLPRRVDRLPAMANSISNIKMTNPIKGIVSKRRKRYIKDGFNLDLAYITDKLIAMGFPAEKLEGVYRNHIDEVYRFLEQMHKDHYKIYNLCSERSYDSSKFHERVERYAFEDHTPPNMELIQPFCEDVHNWLSADSRNVAAVHCKAGKGRTGTMVCCYLLYSGQKATADEALQFYGTKRTHDEKGVTIPSQRRYVEYYAELVRSRLQYTATNVYIRELIMCPPPMLNGGQCTLELTVSQAKPAFKTPHGCHEVRKHARCVRVCLTHCTPLHGDVRVDVYNKPKMMMRKEKLFHFWFNTFFLVAEVGAQRIPPPADSPNQETYKLTLNKWQLDDAHKDKQHKLYSPDFKVELIVQKQPDTSTFSAHAPRAASPSPPSSSASSASEPDTEPDAHWDSGEPPPPPPPAPALCRPRPPDGSPGSDAFSDSATNTATGAAPRTRSTRSRRSRVHALPEVLGALEDPPSGDLTTTQRDALVDSTRSKPPHCSDRETPRLGFYPQCNLDAAHLSSPRTKCQYRTILTKKPKHQLDASVEDAPPPPTGRNAFPENVLHPKHDQVFPIDPTMDIANPHVQKSNFNDLGDQCNPYELLMDRDRNYPKTDLENNDLPKRALIENEIGLSHPYELFPDLEKRYDFVAKTSDRGVEKPTDLHPYKLLMDCETDVEFEPHPDQLLASSNSHPYELLPEKEGSDLSRSNTDESTLACNESHTKKLYDSLPDGDHAFELLTDMDTVPPAYAEDVVHPLPGKDVPQSYDLLRDKGRADEPPPAYKLLPDKARVSNKPRLSLTDVRASWREFSGKFSEHRKKRDKD